MNNQLFEVSVKAVLMDEAGRVLILKERDQHTNWMLPGGRMQPGETVPAALQRELQEEIGIQAPSDLRLVDAYVVVSRSDQPTIDLIFLGSLPADATIKLSPEHAASAWIGPDNLETTGFWHAETKAAIRSIFQRHSS